MTKEFNPQIGDTIVTKERGNFICVSYKEYAENKGLKYYPTYASEPICGVRKNEIGFNTWNKHGECSLDEYSIVEIIPAQKPEIKTDVEISQEFKIRVLELENSMLRTLLRKEGVDV